MTDVGRQFAPRFVGIARALDAVAGGCEHLHERVTDQSMIVSAKDCQWRLGNTFHHGDAERASRENHSRGEYDQEWNAFPWPIDSEGRHNIIGLNICDQRVRATLETTQKHGAEGVACGRIELD